MTALRSLLAALIFALVCAAPAWAAEGRAPIHVQIVLDSSGSMVDNDPHRLSSLAGMIFADLAGPEDSVGILSMRKGKFVTEPISPIDKRRTKVRDSVRSLPFNGPTFCTEPLEAAAEGLAALRTREPKARQFVVFLSDGDCRGADVRPASQALADAGVKIFSIGLFGDGQGDLSADLRTMAAIGGGDFLSAQKASDLPERFAAILGRIVGSEAVELRVEPGVDVVAPLDGYVYDASLIVTGSKSPVVINKAIGPVDTKLELPRSAPGAVTSNAFHIAAFSNNRGSHYSVLRIEEPAAGQWTFRIDGPPDIQALLIQNYALDPVVELGQTKSVYALGESCEAHAWLRGKGGTRIDDAKFLERVEFTLTLADPNGKEHALVLAPGAGGDYAGKQLLDVAGTWTVRGRARMKSGGLDKRTNLARFEVREMSLALAPGSAFDLGKVPAGSTTEPYPLDFGLSDLPSDGSVSLTLSGLPGIRVKPTTLGVGPARKAGEVTFTVEANHAGGALAGELVLEMKGQTLTVPVIGSVIPLSFWERWGRLALTIAIGLLLLFALLFVLYGFVSPHQFPSDARINWGESIERLKKNELIIRELPGTKRGFYRNAKLVVGGSGPLLTGGPVLAEIRVEAASRIVISSPGAELREVNKFDSAKTKPVEGNETGMHSGEIYQVGSIFLRLR